MNLVKATGYRTSQIETLVLIPCSTYKESHLATCCRMQRYHQDTSKQYFSIEIGISNTVRVLGFEVNIRMIMGRVDYIYECSRLCILLRRERRERIIF